jgi:hypothetical protein
MPKVLRKDVPKPLFEHLVQRVHERSIGADAIESLAAWLAADPVVPAGPWFKRFPDMTVCGEGALIKTFLTPGQVPFGAEL